MTVALYPGSFDPLHLGHVDIAVFAVLQIAANPYAAILGKPRQVQQLTGSPRAQPQKTLKGPEVPDIDHLPDVPFDMGLDIIAIPDVRVKGPVVYRRIKTVEKDFFQIFCTGLKFFLRIKLRI